MAKARTSFDLLWIRKKFYKSSGRADLVDPSTYANLGADDYINAGQRYLDRLVDTPKSNGRYPTTVAAGQAFVTVPFIRSVQQVWFEKSGSQARLARKRYEDFVTKYPKLISGGIPDGQIPPLLAKDLSGDHGTPKHFTVPPTMLPKPFSKIQELAQMQHSKVVGGIISGGYSWSGILLGPAPSEAITIGIYGKFFSPDLVEDVDTSWWVAVEPDLLVWASMYMLEVDYRNREGQADWQSAILNRISQIDHDSADEESAEVNQMEG